MIVRTVGLVFFLAAVAMLLFGFPDFLWVPFDLGTGILLPPFMAAAFAVAILGVRSDGALVWLGTAGMIVGLAFGGLFAWGYVGMSAMRVSAIVAFGILGATAALSG